MDLMDIVKQQLTPDVIGQIAQNTGATEQQAAAASHGAATAILAALNNQAQTPDGAEALHATLENHDGSVLDNVLGLFGGAGQQQQQQGGGGLGDVLGSVLGGGGGGGLGNVIGSVLGGGGGGLGNVLGSVLGGGGQQQQQQQQSGGGMGDILGNIFGGNIGSVVSSISHMSGMNNAGVMQLLMQFAPMILGILGQQKNQQNLAPSGLTDLLGATVNGQQGNPIMQLMSHVIGGGNTQQGGGGIMDTLMSNVGSHLLGGLFGK